MPPADTSSLIVLATGFADFGAFRRCRDAAYYAAFLGSCILASPRAITSDGGQTFVGKAGTDDQHRYFDGAIDCFAQG